MAARPVVARIARSLRCGDSVCYLRGSWFGFRRPADGRATVIPIGDARELRLHRRGAAASCFGGFPAATSAGS